MTPLQRDVCLAVLAHGPMSRLDLSHRLDVSRSRLSPEVGRILERSIVREVASAASTGGRRGSLLALADQRFGVVAGIDIDTDGVTVALTALDGTPVGRSQLAGPLEDPPTTLSLIGDELELLLPDPSPGLRALGVSIAGDVDREGDVTDPPPTMPQWAGTPIVEYFSRRFSMPTYLDNDVNVLAIAQGLRGGAGSAHGTYAVVKIRSGVGSGIVVDGNLARGISGHAGDIGHVCLDPTSTIPCACGNAGCLESIVSTPALIREASRLARDGLSPKLATLSADHPSGLTRELIGQAALDDPATSSMLRTAGRHVGFVIAALVSILNPGAVFVSTGIPRAGDIMLSAIRQRVFERARPAATRELVIEDCGLADEDAALGAAAYACQRLLAD